ncbi:MAG: SDR family NAD(P)-dependent oxidoreductase [Lentisphaeria bacterium]
MVGKIAVITGVSKGIGEALVMEFKKNDFTVVGISRHQPSSEVDYWIEADLTNGADVDRVIRLVSEKYDGIDVLVNNAGRGHYGTWEESNIVDLVSMFELNFFAMVKLTQQLLGLLKKRCGTVINISSVAAHLPVACMGAYCASKAAVNAFSESLQIEMLPYKVNVLNVEPGRISTGFSLGVTGSRRAPKTAGAKSGPEMMVKIIFDYYKRGKQSLTFPRWYKIIYILRKVFKNYYANKNLEKWGLK